MQNLKKTLLIILIVLKQTVSDFTTKIKLGSFSESKEWFTKIAIIPNITIEDSGQKFDTVNGKNCKINIFTLNGIEYNFGKQLSFPDSYTPCIFFNKDMDLKLNLLISSICDEDLYIYDIKEIIFNFEDLKNLSENDLIKEIDFNNGKRKITFSKISNISKENYIKFLKFLQTNIDGQFCPEYINDPRIGYLKAIRGVKYDFWPINLLKNDDFLIEVTHESMEEDEIMDIDEKVTNDVDEKVSKYILKGSGVPDEGHLFIIAGLFYSLALLF